MWVSSGITVVVTSNGQIEEASVQNKKTLTGQGRQNGGERGVPRAAGVLTMVVECSAEWDIEQKASCGRSESFSVGTAAPQAVQILWLHRFIWWAQSRSIGQKSGLSDVPRSCC